MDIKECQSIMKVFSQHMRNANKKETPKRIFILPNEERAKEREHGRENY